MNDRVPPPSTHRYHDPLALVWIACAERVGFRIERTPHAYASTDGRGTIYIGTDDLLDPDDSLAQMILHELCHALVEGGEGERQVDWVWVTVSGRIRGASMRVCGCKLSGRWRRPAGFCADHRFPVTFWNSLPADPFAAPPKTAAVASEAA